MSKIARGMAAFIAMALISFFVRPLSAAEPAGGIYPSAEYCQCENAMTAAHRSLQAYRGNKVEQVRETTRLLDEIKRSRVFEVTIESRHDASLRARITWKGSPWQRYQALEAKLSAWEGLASFLASNVGTLSAIRASLRSTIETLRKVDPESGASSWMLPENALDIIEQLHRETKQLVRLTEELRDRLYCTHALPQELSIIAVVGSVRNCRASQQAGPRGRMQGGLPTTPNSFLEFSRIRAGEIDLLAEQPERQVYAALERCEQLGIGVKALPLEPPPPDTCGLGPSAVETAAHVCRSDRSWIEERAGDEFDLVVENRYERAGYYRAESGAYCHVRTGNHFYVPAGDIYRRYEFRGGEPVHNIDVVIEEVAEQSDGGTELRGRSRWAGETELTNSRYTVIHRR